VALEICHNRRNTVYCIEIRSSRFYVKGYILITVLYSSNETWCSTKEIFVGFGENTQRTKNKIFLHIKTSTFLKTDLDSKKKIIYRFTLCWVRQTKKAEEDATFCLIKDGAFFPLFCLKNLALVRWLYLKGNNEVLKYSKWAYVPIQLYRLRGMEPSLYCYCWSIV
jgi:hypothetical protein